MFDWGEVDQVVNNNLTLLSLQEVVLLRYISCLLVFIPRIFVFPVALQIQGDPPMQGFQIIILVIFDVTTGPEEGNFLELEVYDQDDVEVFQ